MVITEFKSINEIVADAISMISDEGFKNKNIGWYRARVKECIRLFRTNAVPVKTTKTLKISECNNTPIPTGVFGIYNVYVHNNESCDIATAQKLDLKLNAECGVQNYQADVSESGNTDFVLNRNDHTRSGHYWMTIGAGKIQFSRSALSYSHCTMLVGGAWMEIDGEPLIPIHVADTATKYVEFCHYRQLRSKDPQKWRTAFMDSKAIYDQSVVDSQCVESRMDFITRKRMAEYLKNFMTK